MENAIVVALGSNLAGAYASTRDLLDAAIARFPQIGLRVLATSRWWRAPAWPDPTDPEYLNGVALVETGLTADELIQALLRLEKAFGRVRSTANAPRTLDLDLIAHGRQVSATPTLVLPHPRAHLRRFVMGPLAEIAPDWRHPTLGLTAAELAIAAEQGREAAPA